jgi:type II secretory pathway component PulJ
VEKLKYRPLFLYTTKRKGLTIIEALVVSLIIVLVLLSIWSLYLLALRGREWGERKADAETRARLAMEWILRDIRMAMDVSLLQEGASSITLYLPMMDSNGNILLPMVRDPVPVIYYLSNDGKIIHQKGTETRTIADGIASLSFYLEGTLDRVKVQISAKKGEQVCSLEAKAWARN